MLALVSFGIVVIATEEFEKVFYNSVHLWHVVRDFKHSQRLTWIQCAVY